MARCANTLEVCERLLQGARISCSSCLLGTGKEVTGLKWNKGNLGEMLKVIFQL